MKSHFNRSAQLIHNTYRLYSKLLAAENITVVFDQKMAAPADFDLLRRILRISPVHSTQEHLIPGLVVHEVGHALFSHLSKEDAKKMKKITILLNIIDDGYQERMMCKKYPAAKDLLFSVFEEFFIKSPIDFNCGNKLTDILNILNYNCKGFKYGYIKEYPSYILKEDLDLLKYAEQCVEDTLMKRWELSKELGKALKKYGILSEDGKEFDFNKSESQEKEDQAESEIEEESEPDSSGNCPGAGKEGDSDLDDLIDSDKFHDHHKKIDHKKDASISYEIISAAELEHVSSVKNLIKSEKDKAEVLNILKSHQDLNLMILETIAEAKKVASMLFTKFNSKAQAKNFALSQQKRTGVLDPDRASLFSVFDDIFVKQEIMPDQINHAYSICLDWSGSMSNTVYPLILRILELMFFSKMADVEIDIFCYTTENAAKTSKEIKRNVAFNPSIFYDICNTKKMSNVEILERAKILLIWYYSTIRKVFSSNSDPLKVKTSTYLTAWNLSGTNIFEALLRSHGKLEKMIADRKTCLILSDGEDTGVFTSSSANKNLDVYFKNCDLYLNGINIESFEGKSMREKASVGIAKMYETVNQKTVGIAWNCDGGNLNSFCSKTIKIKSANTKTSGYIHADNFFIKELIDAIV